MTPELHLAFAEQNYTEAEHIARIMQFRWAAVAYFYAAMHMVHACLPTVNGLPFDQQHPEKHTGPYGTSTIVRKWLPQIDTPYRSLFSASIQVRYDGEQINQEMIVNLRRTDLPVITWFACKHLHGPACPGCWLGQIS